MTRDRLRPLATLAVAIFALLHAHQACAQVEWESCNLELHPLPTDTKISADFHFTNTGKTPVKVKVTATSCGCTTASLQKETYAPGEKGTITAIFEIGGREGVQKKSISEKERGVSQQNLTKRGDGQE